MYVSTFLPTHLIPNELATFFMLSFNRKQWTGWDLNPWPPACKAGDLPLIYRPITDTNNVSDGEPITVNIFFDRRGL